MNPIHAVAEMQLPAIQPSLLWLFVPVFLRLTEESLAGSVAAPRVVVIPSLFISVTSYITTPELLAIR